jgi:hypothetical protein
MADLVEIHRSHCRALDSGTGLYTRDMGVGLFACNDLRPQQRIAEFQGEIISRERYADRERRGLGGYAIHLTNALVLDCFSAYHRGQCIASAANSPHEAFNIHTGQVATANATLAVHSPNRGAWRATLRAARPIRRGHEILWSYSTSYVFPASPRSSAGSSSASSGEDSSDDSGSSSFDEPAPPGTSHRTQSTPDRSAGRRRDRLNALPVLRGGDADDTMVRQLHGFVAHLADALQLRSYPSRGDVATVLRSAHDVAAGVLGIKAAQEYGADFRFPAETLHAHRELFLACGRSLPRLARHRQHALAASRLSIQRVEHVFGKDGRTFPTLTPMDYRRLRSIASPGIDVLCHSEFRPSNIPATLRSKYLSVSPAVHRLMYKQVMEGTLVILPVDDLLDHPGAHLSNCIHWTAQKLKPQGRLIADLSNPPPNSPSPPVNGSAGAARSEVAAHYARRYGATTLPTIFSLMNMVVDQADKHGWHGIQLWKKDLSGAFNLLWFNPDHVPLLVFPLTNGLAAVHLAGLFGLGGLPPAFAVISRAIDAASAGSLQGASAMYVDDDLGVSPTHALRDDMDTAHRIMTDLLGPNAVASNKDECGRRLEWLGWDVDLDARTITVSARNLAKVMHCFFSFRMETRLPAEHVLRLATYASRLSTLHAFLRPFTLSLYREHGLYPATPYACRSISGPARCDIILWRSVLLLLATAPTVFARPIVSFRAAAPTIDIAYDASLTALAVGLSTIHGGTMSLMAYTAVKFPFTVTTDSSYQNTYEYMAVLAGLLIARRLSLHTFSFTLHGDSVSSLQWASTGRAVSRLARRVNIVLALTGLHLRASLADTTHVPGVQNVVYDGLSRGRTPLQVGLNPALQLHWSADSAELKLVHLCDPTAQLVSFPEHTQLISESLRLLRSPILSTTAMAPI